VVPHALPLNLDYDHDHRSAGAELITITIFYPVSFLKPEHPPSQGLRRGMLTPEHAAAACRAVVS
jgi:hypothetical protein